MRTASAVVVVFMLGITMSPEQDAKEQPAKPEAKASWSEAVEGLQCWLEADKAIWKVDEVPAFRLHVRDQGKLDLEIHMAQGACKLEFDGAWYDWQAPVSIPGGTWPAGREYDDFEVRVTLEAPWARGAKPIAVKPGKHKVRVAYVTLDFEQPVRVESNAVEFEVGAGQPMPRKKTGSAASTAVDGKASAEGEKPGSSPQQPQSVSLIQLIATPDLFEGKYVRVFGFVRIEHEGTSIYLHREDAEHRLSKNGLWLAASDVAAEGSREAQVKDRYALIEGRFAAKEKGHRGLWSGAIENITRMQAWEFPSDKK